MPDNNWGGARPGAGRRRTTLHISMPAVVLEQYEQVARETGATLEEVVREALLSWLSDWQEEHDGALAAKSSNE